MADFNTGVDGPVGAPVRPQQPVATPSAVGPTVDIVSKIGGSIASALFANEQNDREVKRQGAINANLESFSQAQLKLASAVDQGSMSSTEARMRQRANYSAAIANNPGLIDEFSKIQKSLTTTAGLAKNVADGTEAEQMNIANQKAASAAGWIPPTAGPAERQSYTDQFLRFKRSQEELDANAKQLSFQRAQIGLQTDKIQQSSALVSLQSARLGLQEKQLEQQGNIALGNLTDSYASKFSTNLQTIQEQVAKGQLTQEEGLKAMDAQHNIIMQTASQVGQNAAGGRLGLLTAPLTEMYNNAKKYISGEITKDLLDTNQTISLGKQKMMILADDDNARTIAASQLLQAAGPALMPAMSQQAVKILGRNMDATTAPANPHPDGASEQKDNKTYLNTLKSGLGQLNSGGLNNNNPAKQEIETHANQVLKGISAYSMAVEKPEQYNDVVDFLASPEYGKFASSQGGVPADQASAAKQVLQQQYENSVVPLLKKEYDEAVKLVRTPVQDSRTGLINSEETTQAATANIKPVFTGAGITFMPIDGSSNSVRLKAKDLNAKVAPVVNRLIRMSAHLGGSQNYKAVYDSQYAAIFGEEQPDASKQ